MSFLRRAATTLGATAIAGGALFLASGPAAAEQGAYSSCTYLPVVDRTVCLDNPANAADCEAMAAGAREGGAISATCVESQSGGGWLVFSLWEDDLKPRL